MKFCTPFEVETGSGTVPRYHPNRDGFGPLDGPEYTLLRTRDNVWSRSKAGLCPERGAYYALAMTLSITIPEEPTEVHRAAIIAPLRAYNIARAGDPHISPVAILLTDERGDHVGGLWGKCAYDWLCIELLAIPEDRRGEGFGNALMNKAEVIARANGCIGLWLDTYEFQARGFYEKLGFELFGTLDDHPIGQKRFFLRKRLT